MTLRLHFSNRFEPLVGDLSAALEEQWLDFGSPPPVVVPSPAVAKWLKLRLCEARGPLVGLPTPTLEGFLWKALDPSPGMKILRADALQQALVPLLDDTRLSRPEYLPVQEYLCPQGEIDVRRRCQLAHEIARLFLEYEYNRPSVWKDGSWGVLGLDQSWPDRPYFAKTGEVESTTEQWQRDLHGAVFASSGPLAESGRLGLPRLHRIRREAGWIPSGQAVMVFGVEKVSHFHRNLLLELSEKREVHLFLVNPCAEFWEDVDTSRRPHRRGFALPRFSEQDYQTSELPEGLYPAGSPSRESDPLLLQRWGRSPRESLSLWSQAVDYNFDFTVEPPIGPQEVPTVLSVLQQAITQRHPGPVKAPLELEDGRILSGTMSVDPSLVLLDCPERGREMEAVRDQIIEWLSQDKHRVVSDAVVLMPDPSRHRTAIHRVFGGAAPGEPGHLPWVLLGEKAGESAWARAVQSLFALAKGGWDRPTVFSLLRNRLVQSKLGVDASTVARWESWAEGSGMIRGWDADHRLEMGDAPQVGFDTHTFRAGLMRLMMAPLADGVFALGLRVPEKLGERISVARDFESDSSEVEVFAACLERLFCEVRELLHLCQKLSPTKLVAEWVALFDSWIAVDDDAEERVRRELIEGLELLGIQEKAGRTRLTLEELEETVRTFLDGELPATARAFAGALTFAPLKAGCLPHGLVILAGFDAKVFPGDGRQTRLDLLGMSPLVGDADAVRDNRALFLQAFLSARSRLVVTWLGRDIQKDEALEPASVVLELEEALKSLADNSCRTQVRLLAREAMLPGEAVPSGPGLVSWDPFDRIEPTPPASNPWKSPASPSGSSIRLTLSEVKSFLTDSFLHHARRTMGWEEEEGPGTLDAAQEALSTTALDGAIWRSELLVQIATSVWADATDPLEELVRRFIAPKAWEAAFPEAMVAEVQWESLLSWARWVEQKLREMKEGLPNHRLVCGADLSLGFPDRAGSLEWCLDGRKVLVGQKISCALVSNDLTDPVILLHCAKVEGKPKKASTIHFSRTLGAQLQAIALAQAGIGHPVQIRFFARLPEVDPVDQKGMVAPRDWLENVVKDLLNQESQYLPSQAILELGKDKLNLVALREKLENSDHSHDLENLFEPELPGERERDDRELVALAGRRLGPFLEVAS